MDKKPETMPGQVCPICHTKNLTLLEEEMEIPYFGKCFLFSMNCSNCKFHKADIEASDKKDPAKFTFDVTSEKDMNVRIVRSSEATIKIPHMISIDPGPSAEGFITNVEGLLNRIKHQIELMRDSEEDEDLKKKAKNMIKKLTRAMWGQETLKIIIEDPSGNSAIISDKAVKSKLK